MNTLAADLARDVLTWPDGKLQAIAIKLNAGKYRASMARILEPLIVQEFERRGLTPTNSFFKRTCACGNTALYRVGQHVFCRKCKPKAEELRRLALLDYDKKKTHYEIAERAAETRRKKIDNLQLFEGHRRRKKA